MTDRRLVGELLDALENPNVDLNDADRKFVRRLAGRDELNDVERKRAERIFAERVDW